MLLAIYQSTYTTVNITNCECIIAGFRSEHLHKVVYLEHRRIDSDLRDDHTNFPSRCIETRAAPKQREYRKLRSLHMAYDNTKSKYVYIERQCLCVCLYFSNCKHCSPMLNQAQSAKPSACHKTQVNR